MSTTVGQQGRGEGLAPGTILESKYEILRELGVGGMGVVYEALHTNLRKRVAIKTLVPELAQREDLAARVVREARLAGSTGHPNVVAVTDLGWVDGIPFFVMELLEGETISDALSRSGPMTLSRAANICCQVLDGLGAVHDVGIIHRDLKPSNVMLTLDRRGERIVKLVDFGISKLAENTLTPGEPVLTQPGSVLGSPRHIAPEQVLAETDIDLRADIHGAGALLYTMLVGRSPFTGPTAAVAMVRVLEGKYEAPTTLVPGLPHGVEAIMAKAMAVDRNLRYATADQMRQALLPYVDGSQGIGTMAPTMGPPPAPDNVPPVASDGIQVDNLPPVVAMSGTEVATSVAWPTASRAGTSVPGPKPVVPPREPQLGLDVPDDWKPGDLDRAHDRSRSSGGLSIPWGVIAVVVALGVGGWAAYTYSGDLGGSSGSGSDDKGSKRTGKPGEVVLLMVDTKPKDAIVFVDDVQHSERPLSIPKTGEYVKLRVEAPGHKPKVLQVKAKASRRLTIKLDKE